LQLPFEDAHAPLPPGGHAKISRHAASIEVHTLRRGRKVSAGEA
jgi:hypothetical protein